MSVYFLVNIFRYAFWLLKNYRFSYVFTKASKYQLGIEISKIRNYSLLPYSGNEVCPSKLWTGFNAYFWDWYRKVNLQGQHQAHLSPVCPCYLPESWKACWTILLHAENDLPNKIIFTGRDWNKLFCLKELWHKGFVDGKSLA